MHSKPYRAIALILALLLALPAAAQKPPINGVAGPTSPAELYSVAPDLMFKRYTEKYISPDPAITAGVLVIDLSLGNIATVQNSENITSFSVIGALTTGASSFVMYVVSAGASNTQAWGGSVRWPNNSAPILTSTVTRIDMIACTLYSDLTTWLCSAVPNM